MKNNEKLYYDSATDKFFIGDTTLIDELQAELNDRLEKDKILSYRDCMETIAESITDDEARREFLKNIDSPWTDDVGFVDLEFHSEPPFITLKWDLP